MTDAHELGITAHFMGGGPQVVQDRCLAIEHARLSGKLHIGSFDTGVILSKRRLPR